MRKLLLLLLLTGCKNDAVTSANITIPVDTLDISTFDTVRTRSTDTLFVFDTTVVVDTIFRQSELDSLVVEVEGYIGDDRMETLDLGDFHLSERAAVWARIELSGNTQKDESWGLRQSGIDMVPLDCPLVPDYSWLGTDWVFVGFADAGDFSLEARHASLYDCYSPVDSFRSANSVHFKKVKFVWLDTEP